MYTTILFFLLLILSFVGGTGLTATVIPALMKNSQTEPIRKTDARNVSAQSGVYSVVSEDYYLIH